MSLVTAGLFAGSGPDPFTVIPRVGTDGGMRIQGSAATSEGVSETPFATLLAGEIGESFAEADGEDLGLGTEVEEGESDTAPDLVALVLGALQTRLTDQPATSDRAAGATEEASANTDIGATEMTSRPLAPDPSRLHPDLRARLQRVADRMQAEFGHEVEIVEGYRTPERQAQLYAQGRTAPGPIVTWTRESTHTDGLAADVKIDGGYDNTVAFQRFARLAQEEGLRSLAPLDPGHVELDAEPFAGRAFGSTVTIRSQTTDVASQAAVSRVAPVARVAEVARTAAVARPAQVATVARPGELARPAAPAAGAAPANATAAATAAALGSGPDLRAAPRTATGDPVGRSFTGPASPGVPPRPELAPRGPDLVASRPAPTDAADAQPPRLPLEASVPPLGDAVGEPDVTGIAARTRPLPSEDDGDGPGGATPLESTRSSESGGRVPPSASGIAGGRSEPAPTSPTFPKVELPTTAVASAERAQRVREILAQAAKRPVQQMQLSVDAGTADEALVNVRMQGGRVSTSIGVRDPFAAERIQSEAASLRASLVRQGLEPDIVNVRTLLPSLEPADALRQASTRNFIPGLGSALDERAGEQAGSDGRSRGFWDSLNRDREQNSHRRGGQR